MQRVFASLLRLYPPEYRGQFAAEMAAVFQETCRDRREEGWLSYVLFLLTEVAGLLYGAAEARLQESHGRRTRPPVSLLLTGGAVSLILVRFSLLSARIAPVAHRLLYSDDEQLQLVVIATVSVVLIAAFSVAFVINLMMLARRRA